MADACKLGLKTVIILTHHNLAPWREGDKTNHNSRGWFRLDNSEEVRALLKKYNVKLVFSGHRHISTRYQKIDDMNLFVNPAISTYFMRCTAYELTPRELLWEVFDIPTTPEVWALARTNFPADKWWGCRGYRSIRDMETGEEPNSISETGRGTIQRLVPLPSVSTTTSR